MKRLVGFVVMIAMIAMIAFVVIPAASAARPCNRKHPCPSPTPTVTPSPSPPPSPSPTSSAYGTTPSITCPAGAVDVTPAQDLVTVVKNAPAGTSFCIHAGTYNPTSPINVKAGDTLTGEYGAIIDGTNVVQGYDVGSTGILRGWNCFTTPCDRVTIRNLVVRNLAAHDCIAIYDEGSTSPGTGWTVDHVEASGCDMGIASFSNGVFTNNYLHDNGCGIGGYRNSYPVIEHNEVAFNRNSGCKWAAGDHITVRNNWFHDNLYDGTTGMNVAIWLDTVGDGNLIENNVVENTSVGIMYEATGSGRVTGNTVRASRDIGIYVSNAWNVEVDNNDVTQAANMALSLFVDPATGYDIFNDWFHDNRVDLTAHPNNAAVGLTCLWTDATVCVNNYGASKNNRFTNNTYVVGANTGYALWKWGGTSITWPQWQAAGQDLTGRLAA
jgi:parallel beta-helix repeat protein